MHGQLAPVETIFAVFGYLSTHDAFWYLFLYYCAFLLAEWALSTLLRRRWAYRATAGNIASGMIGGALAPLLGIGFALAYKYLYEHVRIATLPMNGVGLGLGFVLWEACQYFQHRLDHSVGFFWASHSVHHSAREMNFSVGVRQFWLAKAGWEPLYLLLAVAGLSFSQLVIISIPIALLGVLHHTNFVGRIRWLELVLITPSSHRVHHGTQPKYIDRNFGQTLAIFDHLFGTFQTEEEAPAYGLVEHGETDNPVGFQWAGVAALAAQMRAAPRWDDKLCYLIKPPGWRHGAAG